MDSLRWPAHMIITIISYRGVAPLRVHAGRSYLLAFKEKRPWPSPDGNSFLYMSGLGPSASDAVIPIAVPVKQPETDAHPSSTSFPALLPRRLRGARASLSTNFFAAENCVKMSCRRNHFVTARMPFSVRSFVRRLLVPASWIILSRSRVYRGQSNMMCFTVCRSHSQSHSGLEQSGTF